MARRTSGPVGKGGRWAAPVDRGGVAGLYQGGPWAPGRDPDGVGQEYSKPWSQYAKEAPVGRARRVEVHHRGEQDDASSAASLDGGGSDVGHDFFSPPSRQQQPRGRPARGQQQPRGGGAVAQPPRGSGGREAQAQRGPLLELVRSACAALGRTTEADAWASRLQAEWLTSPAQMRGLSAEEWTRLRLPVGLEAELRRRTGATAAPPPGGQGGGATASRPVRSQSAPSRPRPTAPAQPQVGFESHGWVSPQQLPTRAAQGGDPKMPDDGAALKRELKTKFGIDWPSALLRALRRCVGTERCADLSSLQAACRSLGAGGAATSPASLRGILHAATALTSPPGKLPDLEAVVAVVHGPLMGRRAEVVRGAFDELDADGNGVVKADVLKRRLIVTEHPGVKAGRYNAEDMHRALLRPWKGRETVSLNSFLACHIMVSALWPGDDSGFERMVRGMWRCRVPSRQQQQQQQSGPDGRAAADPFVSYGGTISPPPKEENARRRLIEDRIRRSTRADDLLKRFKSTMKRRGLQGDRGGGTFGDEVLYLIDRRSRKHLEPTMDADMVHEALNHSRVGAPMADVEDLVEAIDLEGHGRIQPSDFLAVMRGALDPFRASVVREAFEFLDQDNTGMVSFEDLENHFQPHGHSDAEAGRKEAFEVTRQELLKFEAYARTGGMSLADFERYYENLSAGIPSDNYFKYLVHTAWGMTADQNSYGARNKHRSNDGHLRVHDGWYVAKNDGW